MERRTEEARAGPDATADDFVVMATRGHLKLHARACERRSPVEGPVWSPLVRAQTPEGQALLSDFSASRELGLYVSGLPGVGKSTLLLHLILEDIRAGRACCVIDPHGDLVTAVLESCPEDPNIRRRILVFDPADVERPVGLDILDAKSEAEQEMAVQFMLGLYEELFLPEHQGPILHQSLANGMRLLMEQGRSLAELPLLFSDSEFLTNRLALCKNPWIKHYFNQIYCAILSSSDGGGYLGYFTSKLARLMDDPMLRNILAQKKAPDLGAHLEGGGVVLANLARGSVGDVNARLLGMILLHKLERVTMARAALDPGERSPLHIYVDEFHELATSSLPRFLGAARKFNVALHLANQRLNLLPGRIEAAVLGTIGHHALFRQGPVYLVPELAELLWPRYGERELLGVPNYEALVSMSGATGEARIGRLAVPERGSGASETARAVRTCSRRLFGRPRRVVEKEILKRLGWEAP